MALYKTARNNLSKYLEATHKTNMVYLIMCKSCKKQYVGETKWEFRYTMAKHTWDTWVKRDTPVSIHFNLPGHTAENMLFQIIHILLSNPESDTSTVKRREREKYWIYQLHTLKPLGLKVFG